MLIASTVVEVGVDVPEASVMLVEAANRFGLAQLHQLRGRVGRGSKASKCYLMAPAGDATATERLQELEKSHNGLHIAEADLRIRWVLFWMSRKWGAEGRVQPSCGVLVQLVGRNQVTAAGSASTLTACCAVWFPPRLLWLLLSAGVLGTCGQAPSSPARAPT